MDEITHWIDGKWEVGEGSILEVFNPTTGAAMGAMREASADQVARAVAAARRSFDNGDWSTTSHRERMQFMRRAAKAILDCHDELTDMQVAEGGMLRSSVANHVSAAASWFDYYASYLATEGGELHRQLGTSTALIERVPIGVCALFTPWNVPLNLTAIKLAPALAAGNSVVLKPSEETPIVTRRLTEIVQGAGLPDGVLNHVNGGGAVTGAALANDPGVDMMSFTGGHIGGGAVAQAAARRHVPCVMELGGKSATIVFDDADLDKAVDGAMTAIYSANGEACLAGSRILVQKTIEGAFLDRFQERAEALTVGDPNDADVDMGPMVSARHRDTVLGFYDTAKKDKDTVLFGGAANADSGGYFVRPGAIKPASNQSRIWREEVFGPIAAIASFDNEDEAIAMANDSAFGLSGYLFTRDIDRAMRVSRAMRTGTVVINSAFIREPNAPFGGFKGSGVGREGGVYSWHNFTEPKTTVIHHG